MILYFYKEFGENGYLATYSKHGFYKDNIYYKTSEHYFQSFKFNKKNVIENIINAKTPKEASKIGRDRRHRIRKDWKLIKCDVMQLAIYYKFISNETIKRKLLSTGNIEIVEETTKENYWGCGINHNGENHYGKLLCKVREQLKEDYMYYFTKEGYKKIIERMDSIDTQIVATTMEMGESDKRDSDIRENSEFMELRVKAMYGLPAEKKEMQKKITQALIIEEQDDYKNWDGYTVLRKCYINITVDGEDEEYTILGHDEGNIRQNIIQCDCALSEALYGHKVGETIKFNGMTITINNVAKVEPKEEKKKSGIIRKINK